MTRTQAFFAALPVVSALVTLVVSQWHTRVMAENDRKDRASQAETDRVFRAREARYDDRRDAVVAFIAAAEDETERIQKWELERQFGDLAPGDVHDDYMFATLNAAYARLAVLADDEVGERAKVLRDAVYEAFQGSQEHWQKYGAALDAFQAAARSMLNADVERETRQV